MTTSYAICPNCRNDRRHVRLPLDAVSHTLQEEHEWEISPDGVIHGTYQCHCTRCGFHHGVATAHRTAAGR